MPVFRAEGPLPEPANPSSIANAEQSLGVRLPAAYRVLLGEHNGGPLERTCYRTEFVSSWANDHVAVDALLGVGTPHGLDGEFGSTYLIAEWGYPNLGVVAFETPSAGHDAVMLDYSHCGLQGEPTVVYVDEHRKPQLLAATFADFIAGLETAESFATT